MGDAAGEYWRGRAGSPRSKGVLATPLDGPGVAIREGAAAAQAADASAPVRLTRLAPSHEASQIIRHFWIPRWDLPPGVVVEQPVLDYPSANLVIEPDAAGVHGPERARSSRSLSGSSWAFGVLLQAGVVRALVAGDVRRIIGSAIPLHGLAVPGGEALAATVRDLAAAGDDGSAVTVVEDWLLETVPTLDAGARQIRHVVDLVEADRDIVRADQLARRAGLTLRTLQRLVREQLGLTPKWLIQRYRMQEAAYALTDPDAPALARLAADLGFADHSHLCRVVRRETGRTPSALRAALARR
ncbi:MAG: AraC family transcriptional regulator [Leifsonia sp.]